MLRWISIFGGMLIMMGHRARSEALFCYFRREDQVPENHLRWLIEKHSCFEFVLEQLFVREQLKNSYNGTGRPSIDPELLVRILLISCLYGTTSKRKPVEELRMHLAWRWLTSLGLDQEIPHHFTFSRTDACGSAVEAVRGVVRVNRATGRGKWDWCGASTCRSMAPSWKPVQRGRPHST